MCVLAPVNCDRENSTFRALKPNCPSNKARFAEQEPCSTCRLHNSELFRCVRLAEKHRLFAGCVHALRATCLSSTTALFRNLLDKHSYFFANSCPFYPFACQGYNFFFKRGIHVPNFVLFSHEFQPIPTKRCVNDSEFQFKKFCFLLETFPNSLITLRVYFSIHISALAETNIKQIEMGVCNFRRVRLWPVIVWRDVWVKQTIFRGKGGGGVY